VIRAAAIGLIVFVVGLASITGNAWMTAVAVLLAYVLGRQDQWTEEHDRSRRGGFINGR
jgi:hypothetical protein